MVALRLAGLGVEGRRVLAFADDNLLAYTFVSDCISTVLLGSMASQHMCANWLTSDSSLELSHLDDCSNRYLKLYSD